MIKQTFDFHGTKITIKTFTSETNGAYTVLYVIHPPNVGPALHMHPKGAESFYIIKGEYEFVLGDKTLKAKTGDVVTVPKGIPHKFKVGNSGGQVLITSPPHLENYFFQVSELLSKGDVSWETEFSIAKQYGQVFLENAGHW